MKILLVEDEKDLSDAVCQILRSSRYEAVPAYDGETGLDEALSGIYDLLLLDIMLPVRDGISILREYRASGGSAPVLLLTAKGEIQDKVRGLDSGALLRGSATGPVRLRAAAGSKPYPAFQQGI